MKKNNIGVLISIIILLCVFLPGAIYGTYMHYKLEGLGGNVNKDFYHEGKLYFYDGDTLLGTYTCITKECGYAKNSVNNQDFEEFNMVEGEIKLINNRYAFIGDGEKVILYDVTTESKIIEYKEIKNYAVGIEGDYYLVKNLEDKWGMIKVNENISVAVQNNYKYLGLAKNITTNNKIDSNKLIAQTEEDWKLITNQNNIITSTKEMIVDYSDYFVVTSNDRNRLYTYGGIEVLGAYQISEIKLLDNLAIALISSNNTYYVYSANSNNLIGTIPATLDSETTFTIENDILVARANDNVVKTIALS